MNKNLNSRTLNSVNNKQNEWITHFWPSLQGKDNKESLMKGVSSRFISLLILLALLHFRVLHYNSTTTVYNLKIFLQFEL